MKMQKDLSLQMHQRGGFFLTQIMKQALFVLELPLLELKEWLIEEVEKNPLLEWENSSSSLPLKSSYLLSLPDRPSRFSFLMEQAHLSLSKDELPLAEKIIGNLDERGYFSESLAELACQWEEGEEKLLKLLKKIQNFDPPGIGARSLQECLLLQLERKQKRGSLAFLCIEQHFDLLLKGKLSFLAKQYALDLQELRNILKKEFSSLTFHPASSFQSTPTLFSFPDIVLEKKEKTTWSLEVNEHELPHFHISPSLKTLGEKEETVHQWLKEGEWLLQSLRYRKNTLERLVKNIFSAQKNYFLEKAPLVPKTLCQTAKELGLHSSTVARAVHAKVLKCPLGLLPLRSFFSSGVPQGNQAIAKSSMKALIKKIISKEQKKSPFSDEALRKELARQGIRCARRTIAKYRKELAVAPAYLRKNESPPPGKEIHPPS